MNMWRVLQRFTLLGAFFLATNNGFADQGDDELDEFERTHSPIDAMPTAFRALPADMPSRHQAATIRAAWQVS